MHAFGPRHMPSSPFQRPETKPDPGALYDATVNRLARRFIYDEDELNPTAIERAIEEARLHPAIAKMDAERRDLQALHELLQGIAAHERANLYHHGAWQAALVRQKNTSAGRAKPPETLTRAEVAQEFEAFEFKKPELYNERKALEHYTRLLDEHPEAEIVLSKNISLDRTDIEVLLIDIRARILERIQDDNERRTALESLDREFVNVIERIPEHQVGKRFELEEIYLLRRLIHHADKGHIASVSHGTPREDLRADRGSVDVIMAAAGDVFEFQFKTFRAGTTREAREQQSAVHERARRQLRGSDTHLVVLKAEDVKETFEASLRQSKGSRLSLADKFAALEPITRDLRIAERGRLLNVIGLTEGDLVREQAEMEKRDERRRQLEEELRAKRQEEERRFAEVEARREAAEAAERERLAGIERHQQEQREAAERARAETVAARLAKAQEREQREAERRAQEEEARIAAEKKTLLAKKRAESAEKNWAPKDPIELANTETLVALGFLAQETRNDVKAILSAKAAFKNAYPDRKTFQAAFPTRVDFDAKIKK